MWKRVSKHPLWSAVISGAVLAALLWFIGYIDLETKVVAAIDRVKAASQGELLTVSVIAIAIFFGLTLVQTLRVGMVQKANRKLEVEKSRLKHTLNEELGIVAFRSTARETVEMGLEEAKGHYRWQGYSSVNVVTPVPNELTIRKKSKEGVRYEFEILNPDSTHGYLLHALHEEKSDDQGKGYIERALSAIREMQGDGINISYRFSNLPPVLRLVTLDSERIFVGIYPRSKCGIDGKELEIENKGNGSLYQFFFEYQKRLQVINDFYDDRDCLTSAPMGQNCRI